MIQLGGERPCHARVGDEVDRNQDHVDHSRALKKSRRDHGWSPGPLCSHKRSPSRVPRGRICATNGTRCVQNFLAMRYGVSPSRLSQSLALC
jgi:hypothetical protein